jgi:polygalacturonase
MKKSILKYKHLLLILTVLTAGLTIWNLPVSNTVYAQRYGVIPNDGIDDTAAINQAIEALKARGGGKLVFPEGQVIVSERLHFATSQNYVSYDIEGDGTEILVNGDGYTIPFYFGNNNIVRINGLTFVGRNVPYEDSGYTDCWYLIFANYVDKITITNTEFYGIRAGSSIVYAGRADLKIENSSFGGSSGGTAAVEAGGSESIMLGLVVKNTNFLDYGNYRNQGYWKSTYHNPAWIKASDTVESKNTVNAMGQKVVRIEDSRFDEAATVAVSISNVALVSIDGINVNVNGAEGSAGIDLSGVGFAEVNFSRFGYTETPNPAIRAANNSAVSAKGITLGGGVFLGAKDAASSFQKNACFGNCTLGR